MLKYIAAFLFALLMVSLALAQAPPPIPPIADAARGVTYNITSSTPRVQVPFPVFGDCTDIQVQFNNVTQSLPTSLWNCSSASGTPLIALPLPITDMVVNFTPPLTSGSVTITGTWHPRHLSVPTASGLNRREFEQVVGTLTASNRELYEGFQASGSLPLTASLASPSCIGCVVPNSGTFTRVTTPILGTSLIGAQGALNPYVGPYPAYLYGIGGIGFYNGANTLANNAFYNPGGSLTIENPYPYGMLNSGVGGSFTTGSNRAPCNNGFTAPSQVGYWGVENGAVALCAASDSQPVMKSVAGTFTATTFTPTAPIAQSASVFVKEGMWVRSSDVPPFNGQVTSFAVDGSNQVTLITVSNWYQEGLLGVAGTPGGGTIYLNPQDKIWASLGATYLNRFQVSGDVSVGSKVITNVSDTSQVYPGGQFLQSATTLFPYKTWVVSKTSNTITVNANATGTLVGETLNISAGAAMGHAANREIDLFHMGIASFTPSYVIGAAATTIGTFDVTGVTNVASLYPHMLLRSNVNLGQEVEILSVNIAGTSIKVSQKATGTGAITYQAYSRFDEGGAGDDCVTIGQPGNTCFMQRGQVAYGYRSSGAGVASFFAQPDALTGNANPYGFLADQTFGTFSAAPFALTAPGGASYLWQVDPSGNTVGAGATFTSLSVPTEFPGLSANVEASGIPGFDNPSCTGIANCQFIIYASPTTATADNSSTFRIQRDATAVTGGTSGLTKGALWVLAYSGKSANEFLWAEKVELHNKTLGTTLAQNAALDSTVFKETPPGGGQVGYSWGGVFGCHDLTGQVSPTYSCIGTEIDGMAIAGSGADANKVRIGLQLSLGALTTDAGVHIGRGIFMLPTGSAVIDNAIELQDASTAVKFLVTGAGDVTASSLSIPVSANAAVATSLGSVGPTGSHTAVQEWIQIKGTGGAIRYVPGF
jgi:hypothetical protein